MRNCMKDGGTGAPEHGGEIPLRYSTTPFIPLSINFLADRIVTATREIFYTASTIAHSSTMSLEGILVQLMGAG